MLVDLLGLTVLAQEAAHDTHAAHPDDLGGEASLAGTAALTEARMATLALGLEHSVDASAGMDSIRLADHVTILDQLAEVLSGVGVVDLVGLVRVEPNLALAALKNAGSKALLQL